MSKDPYTHPRTIHPANAECREMGGEGSIHHFAGAPWLHYHLQQYDLGPYGHGSNPGFLYESTELNSKIANEKRDGRPVSNEEANYIGLGNEPNPEGERYLARVGAWQVYLAGGFYTAGYLPNYLNYAPDSAITTTSIQDFRYLRTFFQSRAQAWWRMAPENSRVSALTGNGAPPYGLQRISTNRAFAMGRTGVEHVLLLSAGGTVTFDLAGELGSWTVTWLNPRSGGETVAGPVTGGASRAFTAPDALDWILYLRAQVPDSVAPAVPQKP